MQEDRAGNRLAMVRWATTCRKRALTRRHWTLRGDGDGGSDEGGGNEGGRGESNGDGTGSLARSTGSHCGGHAPGWLASARLLATLGFAMCGRKAVQKAEATPIRTTARQLEANILA